MPWWLNKTPLWFSLSLACLLCWVFMIFGLNQPGRLALFMCVCDLGSQGPSFSCCNFLLLLNQPFLDIGYHLRKFLLGNDNEHFLSCRNQHSTSLVPLSDFPLQRSFSTVRMVRNTITLLQLCLHTIITKRVSPSHMKKMSSLSLRVRKWETVTPIPHLLFCEWHCFTIKMLTSPFFPPRPHPHSCSDTDRHWAEKCSHAHINLLLTHAGTCAERNEISGLGFKSRHHFKEEHQSVLTGLLGLVTRIWSLGFFLTFTNPAGLQEIPHLAQWFLHCVSCCWHWSSVTAAHKRLE